MVFLIQNSQNREARAIRLKLDEIIRFIQLAHNEMINIEKLSDEELQALSNKFEAFRAEYKLERQTPRPARLPNRKHFGDSTRLLISKHRHLTPSTEIVFIWRNNG
jgi:hypothetical protein